MKKFEQQNHTFYKSALGHHYLYVTTHKNLEPQNCKTSLRVIIKTSQCAELLLKILFAFSC